MCVCARVCVFSANEPHTRAQLPGAATHQYEAQFASQAVFLWNNTNSHAASAKQGSCPRKQQELKRGHAAAQLPLLATGMHAPRCGGGFYGSGFRIQLTTGKGRQRRQRNLSLCIVSGKRRHTGTKTDSLQKETHWHRVRQPTEGAEHSTGWRPTLLPCRAWDSWTTEQPHTPGQKMELEQKHTWQMVASCNDPKQGMQHACVHRTL
eukprot:1139150-Pelagomonas_calceolata.AAC.4